MSDPTRIAVAAARAHDLLTEDHQPLLMTPGAVRALLARTQRRLAELADAVEPVSPAENPRPRRGRVVGLGPVTAVQQALLGPGWPVPLTETAASGRPPAIAGSARQTPRALRTPATLRRRS